MKMYCVFKNRNVIETVEVERATDKTVWVYEYNKLRPRWRETKFERYFDTYAEAWKHLLDREVSRLASLQKQIDYTQEDIRRIIELAPDKVGR